MKIEHIKPLPTATEPPFEPYVVVTFTEAQWAALSSTVLSEGGWRPSGVGDLWVRVNPPKPQMNLPANAHVAHEKHIRSRNRQVSWEQSQGKRHDRLTFDVNFSPMEKAKQVARAALRLPDDFTLETTTQSQHNLLFESSAEPPLECIYLAAG